MNDLVKARAQRVARGADQQVAELTGRSASGWAMMARRLLRDHPLPAVAVTLSLGYVVGKLLRR